jgi:DNA-binding NtrC family response regulator
VSKIRHDEWQTAARAVVWLRNENTAVLRMSGHADALRKLKDFEFPYLAKPFGIQALIDAATRVIAERHENVRRVTDSVAGLKATLEGFRTR